MKKLRIVAVGKIKEKYLLDGIAEYAKRLGKYCAFCVTELADYATADAVKRESDEILAALAKEKSFTVLLDLGGRELDSPEIAETLDRAYLTSPEVTFVIGGSTGVDDRVRAAADLRLSLGRATFPHKLMRLILAEQIYRAFTIIEGTPYHK